jgi:DNA-binding transcriptional LysR family regulator
MMNRHPRQTPMTVARNALTPDALAMVDAIARCGSFAAAARELGKVPSALTYSVRQLEEALDVLLFDRSSRQARLTAAGTEMLTEGRRLLAEMDAVANRVKRVAAGWETQLTVAVDSVISRITVCELCEAYYAHDAPGTRLRLRSEVLAGTLEALTSGEADLAIGCSLGSSPAAGLRSMPLGEMEFVFAVAPHHPLAKTPDTPLSDAELLRHRAIAVADSARRLAPLTFNLLPGQDVLTGNVPAKIRAHLRAADSSPSRWCANTSAPACSSCARCSANSPGCSLPARGECSAPMTAATCRRAARSPGGWSSSKPPPRARRCWSGTPD